LSNRVMLAKSNFGTDANPASLQTCRMFVSCRNQVVATSWSNGDSTLT
jgi:hypothetical protein